MENMNALLKVKKETNENIAELRRKIYQMYPAVSIEDIELSINKINEAESAINNAFKGAIMRECNSTSFKYPRRNRKIADLDRLVAFVIPY